MSTRGCGAWEGIIGRRRTFSEKEITRGLRRQVNDRQTKLNQALDGGRDDQLGDDGAQTAAAPGAVDLGRCRAGWEQPRQRQDGSVLPDGPGLASETDSNYSGCGRDPDVSAGEFGENVEGRRPCLAAVDR